VAEFAVDRGSVICAISIIVLILLQHQRAPTWERPSERALRSLFGASDRPIFFRLDRRLAASSSWRRSAWRTRPHGAHGHRLEPTAAHHEYGRQGRPAPGAGWSTGRPGGPGEIPATAASEWSAHRPPAPDAAAANRPTHIPK